MDDKHAEGLTVKIEIAPWFEPFCIGVEVAAKQAINNGLRPDHAIEVVRAALMAATPYAVRINPM